MLKRFQKPLFDFLKEKNTDATAFTLDDAAVKTGAARGTVSTYLNKYLKNRWVFAQDDAKHFRVEGFASVTPAEFADVMRQSKDPIDSTQAFGEVLRRAFDEARAAGIPTRSLVDAGIDTLAALDG